jgi:hypothetical protein
MPTSRKPAPANIAAAKLSLRPQPHLYEIDTWLWLEQLSGTVGRNVTLGSVPGSEWDRIAAWGFDLVYLMGIWRRSPVGRRIARQQPDLLRLYDEALPGWTLADVIGSPFAITAYEPDPRVGTWENLAAVRAELRQRGMGLVVDFIPNHTAPDHPWIREHPEYYIQGTVADLRRDPGAFHVFDDEHGATRLIAQGRDPYFLPWHDTAQLNYFCPELRAEMIGVLRTIADHADGVRCDMAMLVLNDVFQRTWGTLLDAQKPVATEFWTDAIASVPRLIWIAEVYWGLETRLQELGFDFTYDKQFHDRLPQVTAGDIRGHLRGDVAAQQRMVRFLENHDEPRAAVAFPCEKLFAASAAQALLPGMRFYYDGQFEGKRIRPPLQLARVSPEPPNPQIEQFYRRVMKLAGEDVFHRGAWQPLHVAPERADDASSQNLVAWQWKLGDDLRIVVVNLGAGVSQGRVICRDAGAGDLTLRDDLNAVNYARNGAQMADPGLYVRLQGYGTHAFSMQSAAAKTNIAGT